MKAKGPKGKRSGFLLVKEPLPRAEKQRLLIEFLYLDITDCDRCKGTNQQLEETLPLIMPVLEASGFEVEVRKVHVQNEKQAAAIGLVISPTVRVNNRDIQLRWKATPCSSCSEGCVGEVRCREWKYGEEWYTVPTKALIIGAILREVYGRPNAEAVMPPRKGRVPANLKRFLRKSRVYGTAAE